MAPEVENTSDRIIEPAPRPVPLHSDDRPTRSPRGLAIWIAVMVVMGAAGGGLYYQQLWQEVSDDPTRLLPASAMVYIDTHHPWHELTTTMKLDRWRNREALELSNQTRGVLADGVDGRLAGIPFTAVRRAAVAMERLRVAAVPGPRGISWLLFIEIPDPWARRSVLAQLAPHLTTRQRVLGYPIRALKSDPRWLPWTDQSEPLRFVELEPWLVVSVGPSEALNELIHARVAARSQPLRKRAGFPHDEAPIRDAAHWSFIAPGAFYDLLTAFGWADEADPVALRGLVLNLLRAMTLSGDIVDGDDVLTAQLHLERSNLLGQLGRALAPVSESLLRRLPDKVDLAVLLSVGSFEMLLAAGSKLADEGLEPLVALGVEPKAVGGLLDLVVSAVNSVDGVRPRDVLTGEVLAVHLPPLPGPVGTDANRWVFALPVRDEHIADAYAEQITNVILGADWTLGTLHDAGSAPPLHVVREARLWSEPEGSATPPPRRFVWRVTDGLLVIAATESMLDTFESGDPRPLVGPTLLARQKALRSLRRDSPLVVLASPHRLSETLGSHWSDVIVAPLSDSFYTGLSVDMDATTVTMRSNVGIWTALVALTSTDRLIVDSLMLSDLSPECVRAYLALCSSRAVGPICEAFQPGRKAALASICDRIEP